MFTRCLVLATMFLSTPALAETELTDQATGALIAQEDRVPGNWVRPTYWWEAGEYVTEVIYLPADAAADGHDIWVGWYNPDSGQRLPISRSAPNQVVADDRLLLAGEER